MPGPDSGPEDQDEVRVRDGDSNTAEPHIPDQVVDLAHELLMVAPRAPDAEPEEDNTANLPESGLYQHIRTLTLHVGGDSGHLKCHRPVREELHSKMGAWPATWRPRCRTCFACDLQVFI